MSLSSNPRTLEINGVQRGLVLVARIDDYKEAYRIAAEGLMGANVHRIAGYAGANVTVKDDDAELRITFLNEEYIIRIGKDVDVYKEGQESEISLPEKILICHYVLNASGEPPTGELITFRQIPDGHFYYDAFQRRANIPFLSAFGKAAELFRKCALSLGGEPVPMGDVGMSFKVFPHVSVQIILWKGDEEFPPEASILFDENIRHYLPVEDVAVLSGMLVYRLMGIARSLNQGT